MRRSMFTLIQITIGVPEGIGETELLTKLDNPFTCENAKDRIVSSCNGLLCIIIDESSTIIWNLDESNDYKVVAIPFWGRVKIYSLKSGCQKTLDSFDLATETIGEILQPICMGDEGLWSARFLD
ncbi:hypothetical protein Tco_0580955 [Tanacetum coccineum]